MAPSSSPKKSAKKRAAWKRNSAARAGAKALTRLPRAAASSANASSLSRPSRCAAASSLSQDPLGNADRASAASIASRIASSSSIRASNVKPSALCADGPRRSDCISLCLRTAHRTARPHYESNSDITAKETVYESKVGLEGELPQPRLQSKPWATYPTPCRDRALSPSPLVLPLRAEVWGIAHGSRAQAGAGPTTDPKLTPLR